MQPSGGGVLGAQGQHVSIWLQRHLVWLPCEVATRTNSGLSRLGFESQVCHLIAVRPWAS